MKLLRRVASAIVLAAAYATVFATVFRIRGSGGTPPQHGGWRPLTLPALDAGDDVSRDAAAGDGEPAVGVVEGPLLSGAPSTAGTPRSPAPVAADPVRI